MSAHLKGWQVLDTTANGARVWRAEMGWCILDVWLAFGEDARAVRQEGEVWCWTATLRGGHIIARGEEEGRGEAMAAAAATFAAECHVAVADAELLIRQAADSPLYRRPHRRG